MSNHMHISAAPGASHDEPLRPPMRLFEPSLVQPALKAAFSKLHPRAQWRNPVMFVVYVGSIVVTLLFLQAVFASSEASALFIGLNAVWL